MSNPHRLLMILIALVAATALAALPACRGGGDDDDDDASGDDDTGDDDTGDDDTGDDDTGDDDDDDYRHELTVTDPLVGDFSCLGDNQAEPDAGGSAALTGVVLDFSDDIEITGAKMLLWTSNDPSDLGDADFEFDDGTDQTGVIGIPDGTLNACEQFAYKVWTEWQPPETMPTYEMGNVLPPVGDAEWNNFELISVSYATYQIIPLSLAIQPDPEKGLAAGTLRDCSDETVENGQVLVVDSNGDKAEDVFIRYFKDELPDRDQPWTSDDGIFGAIDVPQGAWTLQLWGVLDDDMPECPTEEVDGRCMVASSEVFVIPDSINIANAQMKPYPDACFEE